jgi:hypothetical protein
MTKTVDIDFRRYPMHRPLPTDKLSRGVMMSAYLEGVAKVWLQSHNNPGNPDLKADYIFLDRNQTPFQTDGRRGGYHVMSFHHAAVDIADLDLLVRGPRGRGVYSVIRAPDKSVPLWVDPIIAAYQRELDQAHQTSQSYPESKKPVPKSLKDKIAELTWRRDLFTAHSVPGKVAIDETSPYWETHAKRVAYGFYDRKVNFQPELPEKETTDRNMLEALNRMHGRVLILAINS